MSLITWCIVGGALCLASLCFLLGATFSYLTRRDQFIAVEVLLLAVREFLDQCDAGRPPFDERYLTPLRKAIQTLDDAGISPNESQIARPNGRHASAHAA